VSELAERPAAVLPIPELTAAELPLRMSLLGRLIMLVVVVLPFLGLVAAIVLLWGWGLTWVELTLLGGMYVICGLGVTVGYHRLFTHRSFETNRVVQFVFCVLGSMAVQGPLLKWVAQHRRHHQHSDQEDDPHSPHLHGCGILGLARGLFHAHMGWLFKPDTTNLSQYVRDLRHSTLLRSVSALFPVWALLGLLIPAALGGLLMLSWKGALLGLVWGGLVRIFFGHHVTWSINSVCHLWGGQPYRCSDESRNNFVFGVLAFGEGWHNNHHAFPTSARHGLKWWQLDVSYWVIRAMALVGLAWNIKTPSRAALATA
jgi:stearoyl-CoA desaturase (delta-9 desaturase)